MAAKTRRRTFIVLAPQEWRYKWVSLSNLTDLFVCFGGLRRICKTQQSLTGFSRPKKDKKWWNLFCAFIVVKLKGIGLGIDVTVKIKLLVVMNKKKTRTLFIMLSLWNCRQNWDTCPPWPHPFIHTNESQPNYQTRNHCDNNWDKKLHLTLILIHRTVLMWKRGKPVTSLRFALSRWDFVFNPRWSLGRSGPRSMPPFIHTSSRRQWRFNRNDEMISIFLYSHYFTINNNWPTLRTDEQLK